MRSGREARSVWMKVLGLPVVLLLDCTAGLPASGRPRAQEPVDTIARQQDVASRRLDAEADADVGGTGIHYDEASDILSVRIFISPASVARTTPQGLANFRKVAAALNDPTIGGMFDRGGGHFILDEARGAYFLGQTYTVSTTDPQTIASSVERMMGVTGLRTTRWFYRVAMIVGGHRPSPDRPVTLAEPGPTE